MILPELNFLVLISIIFFLPNLLNSFKCLEPKVVVLADKSRGKYTVHRVLQNIVRGKYAGHRVLQNMPNTEVTDALEMSIFLSYN